MIYGGRGIHMIVKPKDLSGALVGLHIGYVNGLLVFYCPIYRPYAKLRKNSPYGKTLDCDQCFMTHNDRPGIIYKSEWSCRKVGSSAPATRAQIKDMFNFIEKIDPRLPARSRDKSGSGPSRARARGSCSGSVAVPGPAT